MNRRRYLAVSLGAATATCGSLRGSTLFQESLQPLVNPERGFYTQVAAEASHDFHAIRASGLSLVLLTLDLTHFRDRNLTAAKLRQLETALSSIRKAGLKVIFRSAYGFSGNDYRSDPSDLSLISQHIQQIGEVLSHHSAIVWTVQAGMLGPWGEWHGSTHGDIPSFQARQQVVESWLKALPETVFLQIRRPRFIRDLFPSPTNTELARVGWHNDAMLSLPDDMGTFDADGWPRSRELAWSKTQAKRTPFGGETVPTSRGTGAQQVIQEFGKLRISYLNQGYHKGTLDRWRRTKIADDILYTKVNRTLGYRWVMRSLSSDSQSGKTSLEIENVGFAPVYTERAIEAAWLTPTSLKPTHNPINPKLKLKGHCPEDGLLSTQFDLPPKEGRALLGIRIADSHKDLREDGRYAIRLANENIEFNEAHGWNLLKLT